MTWGRIQYPAMSAFEGASMPYSDQVKENSESMGKEGEKMVKESDFGRLGQKIDWGHFVSQKLHRNRLSVLPPHPLMPPSMPSCYTYCAAILVVTCKLRVPHVGASVPTIRATAS